MGFGDLPYAQQFRDVIREFASSEVNRIRPADRLATVSSIDNANNKATVTFPGDSAAVTVDLQSMRPTIAGAPGTGNVVRVATGVGGRRYVADVVRGVRSLFAGTITLTALQTTGSAANMYVDATTGVVYRSTSSRKYKKNIKKLSVDDQSVSKLRAITFKSKNNDDDNEYLGLIAEDIADLNDPVLNQLLVFDADGKPDAVQYERLAVVLLPVIQHLLKRVADLEKNASA